MNVLIIDDDKAHTKQLSIQLQSFSFVEQIESVRNFSDALCAKQRLNPELVLLDIDRAGEVGFHFLNSFPTRNFLAVFLSKTNKYALRALKEGAFDYLLKPVDHDDLRKAIIRVHREIGDQDNAGISANHIISINTLEDTYFIHRDQIMRISSAGNYCVYHLASGKEIVASYILKQAHEKLPTDQFVRVHHSHVLNLKYVYKLNKSNGDMIIMTDGSEVPVSRRKKEAFIAMFER